MKIKLLILFILSGSSLFSQYSKNFIDQNYIEVTGKSEMEIIPDEIYIDILIREKDNKGIESVEELEKKMIAKLIEIGVDVQKDLSVSDFSSNFKSYLIKKNDILTSKQLQLIVHDAVKASLVFQELEKLEISNLNISRVDHTKMTDFRKEVKVKAVQAAKEKAINMTESIGQSIGKAIFIQEIGDLNMGGRNPGYSNKISIRGFSSLGDAASVPQIQFEKIQIEYSVLVRFELK
jgi:uncharacterized protein YggE